MKTKRTQYTGERFIPGLTAANVEEDHLRRYRNLLPEVSGKRVLDIACGIGYGSEMMAKVATCVVGADIDGESVLLARSRYGSKNCRFVQASAENLPFSNGSADQVVSFETIEHLKRPEKFLEELRRVLIPDGLAVISTPVKKSELIDKFHQQEFTPTEFIRLVSRYFTVERVTGQRWMWTPLFWLFSLPPVNRWRRLAIVKKLYRRLYGRDEIRSYPASGWCTPNFLIVWGKRED